MQQKTRKRLFYSLIVIFLIVGSITVLYAEGWRISLSPFAVSKIGGIYIRTFPKDTDIFIDSKPLNKKVGFLESGRLINSLFPKTYTIGIAASGYLPWNQTVKVSPALVTVLNNAVLVPEKATLDTDISNPQTFWNIHGAIVVKDAKGTLSTHGDTITGSEVVSWNKDGNLLLTAKNTRLTLINLETKTTTDIASLLQTLGIPQTTSSLSFDEYSSSILLARTPQTLWIIDILGEKIIGKYNATAGVIQAISTSEAFISWTEFNAKQNISTLFLYDKAARTMRKSTATISGSIIKSSWSDTTLGLIDNKNVVYLYYSEKDTISKIADDSLQIAFSKNGAVLAVLEHKSIELFPLKEGKDYTRFNLPATETITSISWYADEEHIFLAYPDHVSFLDTNDYALSNVITITSARTFAYNPETNIFYFLNDQGISKLQFLK